MQAIIVTGGKQYKVAEGDTLFIEKLEAEAVKLAAAAKTGNLDNLKAAFGEAAKTCKACHDAFRKD